MKHLYEYHINPKNGKKKAVFTMTFGRKQFIDSYKIDKILITSEHSIVYRVVKKKTNELFVCKVINSTLYKEDEFIIPNNIISNRIVKILEVYQAYVGGCDKTFLIMDYYPNVVDGFDYVVNNNYLKRYDKLKPLFYEICVAVSDCHKAGYCHGDIKLENVIVIQNEPLNIKLIDFGFSFRDNGDDFKFSCGTTRYIAPEVIRDHRGSRASDIWSIGSLIYYIITGKSYVKNHSILDSKKIRDKALLELLQNCLVLDPSERWNVVDVLGCDWFRTL